MNLEAFLERLSELDELHAGKEFEAAYALIVDLLKQQPYSADLLVKRAKLEQLLDWDEPVGGISLASVRAHLEAAHMLAPDAVEPLLELGHLAYAVEDDPEAGLRYFEMALERTEWALREALLGKIKCFLAMGEPAPALAEIRAASAYLEGDTDFEGLKAEALAMPAGQPRT